MSVKWDHSVDVLVVGSGNGALTSALCAHEMGADSVLVVEKAQLYGGTSALSGGGVWVPCNRYAKAAGAEDSLSDAYRYLRATIPPEITSEEMLHVFLNTAPRMIDFLHERTRVRYRTLEYYPDYYSDQPGVRHGHRSMEPEPMNIRVLGAQARHLRHTHRMMRLGRFIGITQVEARVLVGRMPGWFRLALKRILVSLPQRLASCFLPTRRITCGSAGVGRLRWSMLDRNIPLWRNTAMQELVMDGERACGIVVRRGGRTLRIEARRGIVLAAGGFEHNQEMREQYLPRPTNSAWSAGVPSNTGEVLRAAVAVGAATRLMDGAWWCTTISVPGEAIPRLSIMEKSYAGSCVVNAAGERFANESQNYMSFQQEMYRLQREGRSCTPCYMIFDRDFRRSYVNGPLLTSTLRPDWTLPRRYFREKFLAKARDIPSLAQRMGIDAQGLTRTIGDFNEYARRGKDELFGRGDTEYDRYYGNPMVKPNPCLAPIAKPPFYAMRIEPGDFGTHGGLHTDADARVLREDQSPIAGLYAVGNIAAGILTTYPGPGATLAPAMTFAYRAAAHICDFPLSD